MTGPQRKGGRAWRTVRDRVLAADPYCAIRGPRCTGFADTVDHIVAVTMGGAELDPANLRPACARCNYGGGARITNARRGGRLLPRVGPTPYHSPMWCTKDEPTGCVCTRHRY